MHWLELRVQCSDQSHDLIENALLTAGALSITLVDACDTPIYEPDPLNPPIWPESILVGLFDGSVDESEVLQAVAREAGLDAKTLHMDILEDRTWEREWLQHFKPLHFGDNFWVYHQPLDAHQATTLLLDPGLAFGTGTHPTTALCLEWLVGRSLAGSNLIDFGCGSGILGIAALLRGSAKCWFVDIDHQALAASRANLQRNAVAPERFDVRLAAEKGLPTTDLVVANILAGPLINLAPMLASLVKEGGPICLSGILQSQSHAVQEAYQPFFSGFELELRDGWARISAVRKQEQA